MNSSTILSCPVIRLIGGCTILPDFLQLIDVWVSILIIVCRMDHETINDNRLQSRRGWLLFWWVCGDACTAYSSRLKVGTIINHYTRVESTSSALGDVFTRALSSSSLLVMLGGRWWRYGLCTCPCDVSVTYFFRRSTLMWDFEWPAVVGDPLTHTLIESLWRNEIVVCSTNPTALALKNLSAIFENQLESLFCGKSGWNSTTHFCSLIHII